MRARCQAEQGLIPIPIPTQIPIRTMIGRIGNHCLGATPEGAGLFGNPLARRRPKTPLGLHERSPGPDGEGSRRDRRGRRGLLGGVTSEPFSTTALVYRNGLTE